MRGVLVDDHDAVARLRHDVGLVQLRARGAERAVDEIGRGIGRLGAHIGRRRAGVERGLRGFGKARERGRALRRRRPGELRQSQPRRGAAFGRNAAMVASPPVVAVRCASRASASCRARTIEARTRPESRKRTSVLAGCTFTSTSRGSTVTNSATTGWRSRGR